MPRNGAEHSAQHRGDARTVLAAAEAGAHHQLPAAHALPRLEDGPRGHPPGRPARDLTSATAYEQNWQITYKYKTPHLFPAGTILHTISVRDNTANNKHNPDPTAWVGWGSRTMDEMGHGWTDVAFLTDAQYQGGTRESGRRSARPAAPTRRKPQQCCGRILASPAVLSRPGLAAQQGARAANGRPGAGTWAPPATRRSTRSTPPTSTSLEVAWRFKTDILGPRPGLQPAGDAADGQRRAVLHGRRARDAVADERRHRRTAVDAPPRGGPARAECRRGGCPAAALATGPTARATSGSSTSRSATSWSASTRRPGDPLKDFGKNGVVDLKERRRPGARPRRTADIGLERRADGRQATSIMVGASHRAGLARRRSKDAPKGYVRGFDVRTGKRLWIFHTIPRPGEFGNDTWLNDSWAYTGNTGVWTQMTRRRGAGPRRTCRSRRRPATTSAAIARATTCSARASSRWICKTGKRVWHYQLVHHGIWDYDIPRAPILLDITVDGQADQGGGAADQAGLRLRLRSRDRPAGLADRRAAGREGHVPGEWYSPTQPFPTKPPAFERQGFIEDYVIDFTPELQGRRREDPRSSTRSARCSRRRSRAARAARIGTLVHPERRELAGRSFDPETGMIYVYSHSLLRVLSMVNDPKRSGHELHQRSAAVDDSGPGLSVQGLPLIKPPYGRITAIDLNKGDIAWQIAHGETPDTIRNHPLLKGLKIPRTGTAWRRRRQLGRHRHADHEDAGDLRRGRHDTRTPNGQRGAMLRAYDKATGEEVGAVLHARRADRVADDLHAGRQAVHRRRRQRAGGAGRSHRLQTPVSGLDLRSTSCPAVHSVRQYVVSGFSRTSKVRLKADTTPF